MTVEIAINLSSNANPETLEALFDDIELPTNKEARAATSEYCKKLIKDLPYTNREIASIAISFIDGYLACLNQK